MNLNDAVKTCFKKYAEFNGRASRSEFWWYSLFVVLISFAYAWKSDNLFFYCVGNAFSLLTIIPSWAVGSRRLHDVGRSGWWQLLILTIIGFFVLLYWWVQPSQPGPNRYGEEPEADKGAAPASPIRRPLILSRPLEVPLWSTTRLSQPRPSKAARHQGA